MNTELVKNLGKYEKFEELKLQMVSLYASLANSQNQVIVQNDQSTGIDNWVSGIAKITDAQNPNESDYCFLNKSLIDTPLDYYFKWIKSDLGIVPVRSRIMVMTGKTCYTAHYDYTPRLHLPLVTYKHSYFVFPDKQSIHHMPGDGSTYWVDTTKLHTFVNAQFESRMHLVMCIK